MRTRSHKVPLLQSSCAQPQAKAIVHEHFQAVRSAVQKHIRMVRACLAKYVDHTCKRRVYSGSHVQRLYGNPGGIDADHFMSSRNSRTHSCAADAGHSMLTLRPLRHSSTRIGRSAPSVGSVTRHEAVRSLHRIRNETPYRNRRIASFRLPHPATQHVRVQSPRQCHRSNRHAFLLARPHCFSLEQLTVAPPSATTRRYQLASGHVYTSTLRKGASLRQPERVKKV